MVSRFWASRRLAGVAVATAVMVASHSEMNVHSVNVPFINGVV
jgi:hypothetical protein